jgi:hypothetical protein
MFYFWREVGRRMNIKQLPQDYDSFEPFNRGCERQRFHFREANRRVGSVTLELFAGWFPCPFSPIVRAAIGAPLDDALIEGFGLLRPSGFMRWAVPAVSRPSNSPGFLEAATLYHERRCNTQPVPMVRPASGSDRRGPPGREMPVTEMQHGR